MLLDHCGNSYIMYMFSLSIHDDASVLLSIATRGDGLAEFHPFRIRGEYLGYYSYPHQ